MLTIYMTNELNYNFLSSNCQFCSVFFFLGLKCKELVAGTIYDCELSIPMYFGYLNYTYVIFSVDMQFRILSKLTLNYSEWKRINAALWFRSYFISWYILLLIFCFYFKHNLMTYTLSLFQYPVNSMKNNLLTDVIVTIIYHLQIK